MIDREKGVVYCHDCRHGDLLPSYHDFLTDEECFEFYNNPKKKVYDFGETKVSLEAHDKVMKFFVAHTPLSIQDNK